MLFKLQICRNYHAAHLDFLSIAFSHPYFHLPLWSLADEIRSWSGWLIQHELTYRDTVFTTRQLFAMALHLIGAFYGANGL